MRRVWGVGGGRCPRGSAAGAHRRVLLAGAAIAALMVPGLTAAQDSQGGGVPLPEIKVVPTTPATPPPSRRAPATRTAGPARAAPVPAQPAEVAAQPGAVPLDKIPANVQTVPA